ncbi:hypothetical protein H6P81_003684 [Aristolochia fimbriata]|uniref:Integrase catalytic domain-containing protein n=1 Tax=Aristolochia fimbriata TaxID=158543 RepID=A0AAV7FGE5_ARIFI|nr:hypothetical protein H6P81_003684 [Aristolochia fimbriata]
MTAYHKEGASNTRPSLLDDEEQFRRVSACTTAKEAWKILEVHYEGTESVRAVKLQMLMTQFELIRMREDETILEFEGKIRDIANQSANLGDRIPQDQLVKKTLASNEVTLSTQKSDIPTITLADLDAKVSFLAKGLNKFIRKKCPTYLKKKKSLVAAWSDDSSASEDEECNYVAFTANTSVNRELSVQRRLQDISIVSDEEIDNEDDIGTIQNIIKQWDGVLESTNVLKEQVVVLEREIVMLKQKLDEKEEEVKESERKEGLLREQTSALSEENHLLKQKVNEKEERILKLEEELRKTKEIWVKFDKCKQQLDVILTQEKRMGNKHGLGYNGASSSLQPARPQSRYNQVRRFIPTCHFCGVYGHIRPYCYKLQKVRRRNENFNGVKFGAQNLVWVKKDISLFVAHTARKADIDGIWYFDNGCSRHMTGSSEFLRNLQKENGGQVTFGDEGKGSVIGIGELNVKGLPKLKNVLLVNGLKVNLISISQLCDQNLYVNFTKIGCKSIAGKKYVMVCVDDFTRFTWVEFLREKSEAFKLFVNLCRQLMTEKGVTIGRIVRIRSNHGKEFENQDFANFCESKGILHEFSAPKTPQQNGIVERKNRTLQEMARTMINVKKLPHKLWAEVVNTACYVSNRVHLRYLTHKTPYELWKGRKPKVHYFREFGSICHVLRDHEQLRKFDSRNDEQEHVSQNQKDGTGSTVTSTLTLDEETVGTVTGTPEGALEDMGVSFTKIQESVITTEKTPYIRVQKNHLADSIIGEIHEGMKIREQLNVIGTKWVFKNKTDEEGNVIRNKTKLVAQGYTQVEGIDFDETFAPVARLESIRLLLATTSMMKIKLHQMDVKSAFLNGYLNEEVYVELPKGFEDPHKPDCVYRLTKALYGLKQAPRAWYERLTQCLCSKGFTRGGVDKTLFIKREDQKLTLAQIYVDDIVFGSTSDYAQRQFFKHMQEEFEMSMVGELAYFLGFQIKQRVDGIIISQEKYARNLVKKFGLEDAKAMRTTMSTTDRICKDKNGTPADPTLYRSIIGSLLYLTASRPDICYSVGLCARFQSAPKESHVKTVKRIIRYVKSTFNLGIWYAAETRNVLAGYSDADWAGNTNDRKSTSGGCFYLGTNLVSWYSKKQNSISLSTAEAEYIATGSCCAQLLWMKQMLEDYGVPSGVLTMYCDNTSAINISKNPVQHSRTKHIDIRHHFIRELVEGGKVILEYLSTENQLADIFTKSLDAKRFEFLRGALGLCCI